MDKIGSNEANFNPILYLYETKYTPDEIVRWKNDDELRPWYSCLQIQTNEKTENRFISPLPQSLYVGIGTYQTLHDGELYMCVLIDKETKRIAAFSFGVYRSAELVGKALEHLFYTYGKTDSPVTIHSSRNPIYQSQIYKRIIQSYSNLQMEMTAKGTRGGAAAVSTFYAQLMRKKGSFQFETWQDGIDWLSAYILHLNKKSA